MRAGCREFVVGEAEYRPINRGLAVGGPASRRRNAISTSRTRLSNWSSGTLRVAVMPSSHSGFEKLTGIFNPIRCAIGVTSINAPASRASSRESIFVGETSDESGVPASGAVASSLPGAAAVSLAGACAAASSTGAGSGMPRAVRMPSYTVRAELDQDGSKGRPAKAASAALRSSWVRVLGS